MQTAIVNIASGIKSLAEPGAGGDFEGSVRPQEIAGLVTTRKSSRAGYRAEKHIERNIKRQIERKGKREDEKQ